MAESDSFKVIKALRDGADYFWDSISSLETAIVNALSCSNTSTIVNGKQTPKPKINTKVEGDADIIAQWKRKNLERDFPNNNNNDKIEGLVKETRQNAINLYRKISDDSETQQEINLITLLHAHRLKLIKEVLSKDDKSEEDKLEEIKDILINKGDFNPNFNLKKNIYNLTEQNFQPGDDLELRSFLPEAPRLAKATSNSSSIYPPQRRDPSQDRIILDKETKEQLLFRLNDFEYSCQGVLASGANEISKIKALKTLCQEESTTDYAKEYSDLKSAIRKKIESGASVVYLELCKIDHNALNLTNLNYPEETEEERATFFDAFKQQFLQEKDLLNKVKDKLRQTKYEVNESIEEEQFETKKVESLLNSKAEIIAESGIKNGIDIMHYSLMGYPTLIDAIRTAMYNEAFIEISFAKGRELVEKVRNITGGDETPPSSPRNSRSGAPSPSLSEGSAPPPDYDNYIDELLEKNSTPDEISEEIEYHKIAQQLIEPPIPAPRRPQKNRDDASEEEQKLQSLFLEFADSVDSENENERFSSRGRSESGSITGRRGGDSSRASIINRRAKSI